MGGKFLKIGVGILKRDEGLLAAQQLRRLLRARAFGGHQGEAQDLVHCQRQYG